MSSKKFHLNTGNFLQNFLVDYLPICRLSETILPPIRSQVPDMCGAQEVLVLLTAMCFTFQLYHCNNRKCNFNPNKNPEVRNLKQVHEL